MNISIEMLKREKCTGCGVCKSNCLSGAIFMESDWEGFWYPMVDKNKCIDCKECLKVCPIINEDGRTLQKRILDEKVYAAWSLNPDIRYNSTSGGIFSELALFVLMKKGYICGAVYDEQHMVRHFITDKKEDLVRLRQSKYVQSDMGDIYNEIGDLLSRDETLLFCGTPCQCAAVLNHCIVNCVETNNLYLVDFICRGSNSRKVYSKFLEELKDKYQSNINKVWFKNKTYGWNQFSTKIEFENGRFYLQDRYQDPYIRGYIEENLYIRPSCTKCSFKGFKRVSDLTLADFWGVQIEDSTQDSDGGTSLVMINTEKGKILWNGIAPYVYKERKTLKDAEKGNICFGNSVQHGEHRKEFMRDLDSMNVMDNIERFLKKKNPV